MEKVVEWDKERLRTSVLEAIGDTQFHSRYLRTGEPWTAWDDNLYRDETIPVPDYESAVRTEDIDELVELAHQYGIDPMAFAEVEEVPDEPEPADPLVDPDDGERSYLTPPSFSESYEEVCAVSQTKAEATGFWSFLLACKAELRDINEQVKGRRLEAQTMGRCTVRLTGPLYELVMIIRDGLLFRAGDSCTGWRLDGLLRLPLDMDWAIPGLRDLLATHIKLAPDPTARELAALDRNRCEKRLEILSKDPAQRGIRDALFLLDEVNRRSGPCSDCLSYEKALRENAVNWDTLEDEAKEYALRTASIDAGSVEGGYAFSVMCLAVDAALYRSQLNPNMWPGSLMSVHLDPMALPALLESYAAAQLPSDL